MEKKIIIKQTKSGIGRNENQKRTLVALGLRKLNREVVHIATPQILGMVRTVNHLVEVKEINE